MNRLLIILIGLCAVAPAVALPQVSSDQDFEASLARRRSQMDRLFLELESQSRARVQAQLPRALLGRDAEGNWAAPSNAVKGRALLTQGETTRWSGPATPSTAAAT